MQISAPAKINLYLKVLGKRQDGFHEIETLLAPISLSDELTVQKLPRWIDFQCDDPSIPTGEDNLVVRAARAFLEAAKIKSGVSIALKKRIPHGAGLGGGSSDAASTLLGLNRLFETSLPREALAKIAESIGSDVSFFIFESAAVCKGRGELVRTQRLPASFSLVLLKPAFAVASGWAYSRWKDAKEVPGVSYQPQEFAGSNFVNDLERPVFEKFVFLAELKMWLLNQPEVGAAMMSGSGSTVFAALRPKTDAEALAQRAKIELDPTLWTCASETI